MQPVATAAEMRALDGATIEQIGLPGAVLVLTLATYPYVVLAVRAAMARLDPALLDAARILGEDAPSAFRRVELEGLLENLVR